eukprot:5592418-Pleurochrysis_carterae.AAC.1
MISNVITSDGKGNSEALYDGLKQSDKTIASECADGSLIAMKKRSACNPLRQLKQWIASATLSYQRSCNGLCGQLT